MNFIDLLDEARAVQDFCDGHGWWSRFIGVIAVQRWSQARVNGDIDITLLVGFGQEVPFLEAPMSE